MISNLDSEWLSGLMAALQRLDSLLAEALQTAQAVYGVAPGGDPYRGLVVSRGEVESLLARSPAEPLLHSADSSIDPAVFLAGLPEETDELGAIFGKALFDQTTRERALDRFDLALLLIALAPELDLRYERVYAYLQDDVTRRRPTVDLALNLLCTSTASRLERRAHFAGQAPLLRAGLLQLLGDPNQVQPPLLSLYLVPDEQFVRRLLNQDELDPRLESFCSLSEPEPQADLSRLVEDGRLRGLTQLWDTARFSGKALCFNFHGPDSTGRRQAATGLAQLSGLPLLVFNLTRLPEPGQAFERNVRLAYREAQSRKAVFYLEGLETLPGEGAALNRLWELLLEADPLASPLVLSGEQPWNPQFGSNYQCIPVPFPLPDFAGRQTAWHANLIRAGIQLSSREIRTLASRFEIGHAQIASAVALARGRAAWQAARGVTAEPELRLPELFAATRVQLGSELASLAQKIVPHYTWGDIVLPDDVLEQLHEICQRVSQRERVLSEWGFEERLSLGKGIVSLFAGPSGTGKTMAAEIIANELGLDLYRIDLSGVVSKYIGETEKNLERLFRAGEHSGAILFFDEADALFGKRSEVRDSHDRYANIEISYLLQRMDAYRGVTILATNLRRNLDDAFARRMSFTINFPTPEIEDRLRIWRGIWPAATPLGADVDLPFLASQFKLSGGNIKNIALAAAFLAASEGPEEDMHLAGRDSTRPGRISTNGRGTSEGVTVQAAGGTAAQEDGLAVHMVHLLRATRRELQKIGKAVVMEDFGPYAELMSHPPGADQERPVVPLHQV